MLVNDLARLRLAKAPNNLQHLLAQPWHRMCMYLYGGTIQHCYVTALHGL